MAKYTPEDIRRLAYSPDHRERLIAAQHPDTPVVLLNALVYDVIGSVKQAAAKRPELTHNTRRKLIQKGDNKTVSAVLSTLTPKQAKDHYLHALWNAKSNVAKRYVQKHLYEPGQKPPKKEPDKKTCPTPSKTPYPYKGAALVGAAKTTRNTTTPLGVYPCPCGAWHMTSKVKRKGRRR